MPTQDTVLFNYVQVKYRTDFWTDTLHVKIQSFYGNLRLLTDRFES